MAQVYQSLPVGPANMVGIPMETQQQAMIAQPMQSAVKYEQSMPVLNQQGELPTHSNLYVKNLPEQVDQSTLQHMFGTFGAIETCRVAKNNKPGQNNYGFVKFSLVSQACEAVKQLNGACIDGTQIEVKFAQQDAGEKHPPKENKPSDNLYIRGLPQGIDEAGITQLFAAYGTVKEQRTLPAGNFNDVTGAAALVRLGSEDEAARAVQGLNGSTPAGYPGPLTVKYADSPEDRAKKQLKNANKPAPAPRYTPYTTGFGQMPMQVDGYGNPIIPMVQPGASNGVSSVYIRNLPEDITKLQMYEKFASCGGIRSIKLLEKEAGGVCKGVGFVNFIEPTGAAKAVATLNNHVIGDKTLQVTFQKSSNERKRNNNNNSNTNNM